MGGGEGGLNNKYVNTPGWPLDSWATMFQFIQHSGSHGFLPDTSNQLPGNTALVCQPYFCVAELISCPISIRADILSDINQS